MKLFKKILVILIVSLISAPIYSQTFKEFSTETEVFFEQLDEFFSTSSKASELKKFHKSFEKFWLSGKMSVEEQTRVMERCTDLKNKYGKPYPHFFFYLSAVELFFEKEHPMPSYHQWDDAILYLINKKGMVTTLNFIKSTITLLENNELFASSTATWRASRLKSFTYSFENEIVKITFPPTDLVCESAKNEFVIYQAAGYYLPFEVKWIGEKGKTTWERSGFNTESVYADLGNYEIDFKKNYFKADSVWFTNKNYYPDKIQGSIHDQTIAVRDKDQVSYPKFESYQQIFEIPEIYPGIHYKGGFTMYGSRFIGSGTIEHPATLRFIRADSTIVYCESVSYIFKEESVIGRNTAISIYIKQDSIYHPGLLFKYDVKDRELQLIRNEDTENMSRSPYFNSYHMIDMDFPQLTWKIDNPKMEMGGIEGSTVNKASFESSDYFREARYNEIGMNDRMHPLLALKKLSIEKKSDHFTVSEFANYLRIPPIDAVHLCLDLSFRGLIRYDKETQTVYLKERVDEYLNARVGKIDYDVIQFNSEHDVKGLSNASLDLNTFELDMLGVSKIQVSDSQNVVFYPRGSQLTMSKNRDFKFDGIIDAGLFTFYGRGFDFSYDKFKIGLKNVDSLKIKVESFNANEYGVKPLVEIKNALENITGDIFIDDPGNKSSVKNYPQYPIFNSDKPSFVYYDYPAIYGGVYDRKKFFFQVDPFSIDSINSFSTEGLFFEGDFHSADIFENMREKIIVQPDYSFGFTRTTGSGGYPVYKGKGKFTDTINLSFNGLIGIGKIDYLNTHTESSKGVTFFPDSVNGMADTYTIRRQSKSQGTEYPQVNGEDIDIHWEPYMDRWVSKETGKEFKMYGDTTFFQGALVFTPKGLGGSGKYAFSEAFITSEDFQFKEKEVLADKSNFDLASRDNLADMAFQTENVETYVNFETKKANFKANSDRTIVQFPKNKYVCYLSEFTWDMVTKQIELGDPKALTDNSVDAGLYFRSQLMSQDTISFTSPYAKYDLNNYIIDAYKVPFIDVADSRIFPHPDSIITIRKEAKMKTIKNATFLANRDNKYHKIYDATFNITGMLDYSGNGLYDYIDENKQKQTIMFTYIGVDSVYRTYGRGKILEADTFKLSPQFSFYGDVRMNAWRKHLTFDGNTLIENECSVVQPQWFKFKSEINPDTLFIPVSTNPVSRNNDTLATSIYVNYRPTNFYTGFFSERHSKNDIEVVDAKGYLFYDKNDRRYKIGSQEKILDNDLPGNLLTYHKEFCNSYGEGKLDLGVDLGQVKLQAYGSISHNIVSDRITLETMLTVDFLFDDGLMKAIADTITNKPTLKPGDLTKKTFKKSLAEILGTETAKMINDEIQLYGMWRKFPKELVHTITFSYVDFVWDTSAFAYRSVGQLGILSIGDKEVNKMVNGYIEIAKHYQGDMITMYFNLDDKWYFFRYDHEVMQFIASEAPFNLALEAIKEPKRVMSVSKKEAQYKYQLSSQAVKNIFVEKFKAGEGYVNIMPPTVSEGDGYDDGEAKPEGEKVEEKKEEKPTKKDEYDEYDDE